MKKSEWTYTQIRIPPDVLAWVKAEAVKDLRSANSQVVEYIKRAMEQAERKAA